VEAQNRNASDELPGAASSLREAFEVPDSDHDIRAIYGENQWRYRGLDVVFATPDGSDNLWHDRSRELFWYLVRSVQSTRGRTGPLKVEFETVHNRVFWEVPASTMWPADNLVTEVEIRFLGLVDLRDDFGIIERHPQLFTNLEVLSITAAANTWREDPVWICPDIWYNGNRDRYPILPALHTLRLNRAGFGAESVWWIAQQPALRYLDIQDPISVEDAFRRIFKGLNFLAQGNVSGMYTELWDYFGEVRKSSLRKPTRIKDQLWMIGLPEVSLAKAERYWALVSSEALRRNTLLRRRKLNFVDPARVANWSQGGRLPFTRQNRFADTFVAMWEEPTPEHRSDLSDEPDDEMDEDS
jgi:hypothetical protein